MANFGLIIACIGLGWLLRRLGRLPEGAHLALNAVVISVSLPAVTLLAIHDLEVSRELLFPAGMAWLLFGFAAIVFGLLGRWLRWSSGTKGALLLTGGLSNTSFVGFPLLEALFGSGALAVGVITDQAGSFLTLSSLGVIAASILASGRGGFSPRVLARKLLGFPPFLAMIAALALRGAEYPAALKAVLEKLSATMVPLALLSVGYQMRLDPAVLGRYRRELALGLAFKLLLGPALIAALYVGALGAHGWAIQITIAQAAMAPMVTGAVLAAEHSLEPDLANLMVAIGIPLSLLTVPAWAWLLRGV